MVTAHKLSEINLKEEVVIQDIQGDSRLRTRLNEIGFIPGTIITLFSKVGFGGPLAFNCRGAKIALRRKDAANILVSATT